ncbi:MAG: sulfite exporter TauE/SafE family protein [Dehalococcoidia bacterium]
MSWTDLLLVPLGFAVGAYGALVGVGGGFVLVPALLIIYPDESQETITSISLFVVLANSISGSIAYARRGQIDYRTGVLLAAVAVPASVAGAFAVRYLPRHYFDLAFGIFLLAVAALLLAGLARGTRSERAPLRPGRGVVVRTVRRPDGVTYRYAYDARQGLVLSAASGFIATLFGVGGGIMQVPVMITVLRLPVDIAVATSQFMLVFMSASGTSLHAITGDFAFDELSQGALLALGAVVGAQVGALLSRRLSGTTITRLLAVALVAVGIRLLLAPVL